MRTVQDLHSTSVTGVQGSTSPLGESDVFWFGPSSFSPLHFLKIIVGRESGTLTGRSILESSLLPL